MQDRIAAENKVFLEKDYVFLRSQKLSLLMTEPSMSCAQLEENKVFLSFQKTMSFEKSNVNQGSNLDAEDRI